MQKPPRIEKEEEPPSSCNSSSSSSSNSNERQVVERNPSILMLKESSRFHGAAEEGAKSRVHKQVRRQILALRREISAVALRKQMPKEALRKQRHRQLTIFLIFMQIMFSLEEKVYNCPGDDEKTQDEVPWRDRLCSPCGQEYSEIQRIHRGQPKLALANKRLRRDGGIMSSSPIRQARESAQV